MRRTYVSGRYQYKRVGTMTYEVMIDGIYRGDLWRTREGWRTRDFEGRVEEHGAVSRDVAASGLARQ